MRLFELQGDFLMVVSLVLFVVQAWAFIDAVSRRPEVFDAASDKLNKKAWLIILGLAWSPTC